MSRTKKIGLFWLVLAGLCACPWFMAYREKPFTRKEQIGLATVATQIQSAGQGDAKPETKMPNDSDNSILRPLPENEAFATYQKAAEQGLAEAQFVLAHCYQTGDGVQRDYAKAAEWYRKAAEQGNAHAQYSLGLLYSKGQGVAKDSVKAVEWYRKAAEQGEANAQGRLGYCYFFGDGVGKDSEAAAEWYQKAAQQGNVQAQLRLGIAYFFGWGVTEDHSTAANWYRKAAEQGNPESQKLLGILYQFGDGVDRDLAIAAEWYRKAALQGNADAQQRLGTCYDFGHGVMQDHSAAASWYHMSAQQGNADAQRGLGVCYENGEGVGKDSAKAVEWYRRAAEQGNADGQADLGRCYYQGLGVQENDVEAAVWFRKAAEQGNALAQYYLGLSLSLGNGVAKDDRMGAAWWNKSAMQGNSHAQASLAICYLQGEGVPVDKVEAYKWANLSSAQDGNSKLREVIAQGMTPKMISEAQRRSSAFVATKETSGDNRDIPSVQPELEAKEMGSGTGFFVSDDGYLITCEHVVHKRHSFTIQTANGNVSAKLVATDAASDLALLKVIGTFEALPFLRQSSAKLGDPVFTVGFPNPDLQGVKPKLTSGEISGLSGMQDDPSYYQISVPVQPGNSGGALVDEAGNVVGVITSRLADVATYKASGALPQNVNYAVKGGLLYEFLKSVPGLQGTGQWKPANTTKNKQAANLSAQAASVLVIVE